MLAGSLIATQYGKKASMPLRTYASELNPYKADFGSEDVYLSYRQPASVAIYNVLQLVVLEVEDRSKAGTLATWNVKIYHDALSPENGSFVLDLESPAVERDFEEVSATAPVLIQQSDLQFGYNTVVAEVEVLGVGSSTVRYTVERRLRSEEAVLLPVLESVTPGYPASVDVGLKDPAAEFVLVTEFPGAETVEALVEATEIEPLIQG